MKHDDKTSNFILNHIVDTFIVRIDRETNPYGKKIFGSVLEWLIASKFPELKINVEYQPPFEPKPSELTPEELKHLKDFLDEEIEELM